jgi:O-antigen/teichoic acid export membrane protein
VSSELRRRVSAWIEAGRKTGFVILLVAGSAALGILIALPLWLFATRAREGYTITILALAAGAVVYLVVRAIVRRRSEPRDPGRPRGSAASALLTTLIVIVAVAGLYLVAAVLARGMWILGALAAAAWAALLWLLGRARGAARNRKARPVPAENKSR